MIEYVKFNRDMRQLALKLGENVTKAKRAGMLFLVETIEARAVKEAPVKTGDLADSITSEVNADGSQGIVRATSQHARYVHEGTGIYGPYKKEFSIVPKNKKALFWEGARHPVKKVTQKGIHPNPFFKRSIKSIRPQEVFEEGVLNYLKRGR
jgi:HK97 gp10 family phage protein